MPSNDNTTNCTNCQTTYCLRYSYSLTISSLNFFIENSRSISKYFISHLLSGNILEVIVKKWLFSCISEDRHFSIDELRYRLQYGIDVDNRKQIIVENHPFHNTEHRKANRHVFIVIHNGYCIRQYHRSNHRSFPSVTWTIRGWFMYVPEFKRRNLCAEIMQRCICFIREDISIQLLPEKNSWATTNGVDKFLYEMRI